MLASGAPPSLAVLPAAAIDPLLTLPELAVTLPELVVALPELAVALPEVSGASPLDVSPLDSSAPDPARNPEEEPDPELWPEVAEAAGDDPCPPHPIAQTKPSVMASLSLDR
jgi:hypothetical protein